MDSLGASQVIGVDPNLGDYDDRTALHLAASNGHLETITRMLEFGYLDPRKQMVLRYGLRYGLQF